MKKTYMSTMSQVMDELRQRGYLKDFNLSSDCIYCNNGADCLFPEDFHIDRVYRFEGESDPSDEAILYAISSEKHGLKGLLVNGYGVSSDPLTEAMVSKLRTN
jgi:hypothetical protein